jgi:hypothetical protein
LRYFVGIVSDGGGVRFNPGTLRQPPEMRFGLGTIVEAEDTRDYVGILRRNDDASNPAAEISPGMAVLLELHAECLLHGADRSRKYNRSPRQFSASFVNREIRFLGKLSYFVQIGRVGAVGTFKVLARHGLE